MSAEDFFEQGKSFFIENNFEEALNAYEKAIDLDKEYAFPWNGKGNVLAYQKKYDEALIAYQKAIGLDEKWAYPWNGKGNVLTYQKKYDEALISYEKVIDLDKELAAPWNGKGNILNYKKKYLEAVIAYEKAIELDEELAQPWHGKGNVFCNQKKYDEALIAYEKAIDLDDKWASPWNEKGNILSFKKKYDEALIAYEKAINLDIEYGKPWDGKGNLADDIGETENAKQYFFRSFFLDETLYFNPLIFFQKHPTAPFLQSRLLTHLPDNRIHEFTDLILTTHDQCHAVQAWLEWLTASASPSANWLGRLHFYMGDCIEAYRLLCEEALVAQPEDLQTWFYAVLAAEGFCEKTEPLFEKAMPIAEGFLPPKKDVIERLFGRKLPPVDAKQCYYAGRFFLLSGEKEKALACFSRCTEDFLPARHFETLLIRANDLNDGKRQAALEKLVAAEKQAGKNGFAKGIEPHFLTIDAANFEAPLDHFSFYQELEEPLKSLRHLRGTGLSIKNPDAQKPLWELWKLDEATKRRIVGQLFWKKWEAKIAASQLPDAAEKQAELAASKEKLHQLFDALEAETNAERRFLKLGLRIQEWDLSPQLLQQTVVVAQANGFISPSERAVLHCFVLCKSRGRWLQIDWASAGTEEAMQKIIEKIWDGMGILAGFTGGGVIGAFVGGSVALLIKNFLQPNACRAEDFKTFKTDFDNFLGNERERLGDGAFKRLYRIFENDSNLLK